MKTKLAFIHVDTDSLIHVSTTMLMFINTLRSNQLTAEKKKTKIVRNKQKVTL